MAIRLTVNGRVQSLDVDPSTPLLYVLNDELRLNGPKFGCGLGQCGACTAIVNGRAVRSCITVVSAVADAEVVSRAWAPSSDLTRCSRRSSTSKRRSAASV